MSLLKSELGRARTQTCHDETWLAGDISAPQGYW